MSDQKTIHKAREIKYALYGEIRRQGWGPHHPLPSERALAERFGANPVTVRKAFREMVLEGAIYQVERVGRFVSPEVRMGQVLLVVPTWWDFSLGEFFRAFANEIRNLKEPMLPVLVAEADFMGNLNDLENVFRDVVFTVFFRAPEVFAKARPVLDRKGIPCCFYGSDAYASMLEGANVMLYREARIADMVLDRLTQEVGQGHGRPVATLHAQSVAIQVNRHRVFEERCRHRGLALDPSMVLALPGTKTVWGTTRFGVQLDDGSWEPKAAGEETRARIRAFLENLARHGAGLYIPVDGLAIQVHQAAHDLGLRIPWDFRTVSVDNQIHTESMACPLTTVDIPVFQDGRRLLKRMLEMAREGGDPFRLESEVTLVARASG